MPHSQETQHNSTQSQFRVRHRAVRNSTYNRVAVAHCERYARPSSTHRSARLQLSPLPRVDFINQHPEYVVPNNAMNFISDDGGAEYNLCMCTVFSFPGRKTREEAER